MSEKLSRNLIPIGWLKPYPLFEINNFYAKNLLSYIWKYQRRFQNHGFLNT